MGGCRECHDSTFIQQTFVNYLLVSTEQFCWLCLQIQVYPDPEHSHPCAVIPRLAYCSGSWLLTRLPLLSLFRLLSTAARVSLLTDKIDLYNQSTQLRTGRFWGGEKEKRLATNVNSGPIFEKKERKKENPARKTMTNYHSPPSS